MGRSSSRSSKKQQLQLTAGEEQHPRARTQTLVEEAFPISSTVNFNVFTWFHKASKNKRRHTERDLKPANALTWTSKCMGAHLPLECRAPWQPQGCSAFHRNLEVFKEAGLFSSGVRCHIAMLWHLPHDQRLY